MIYELNKDKYEIVRSIFEGLKYHLAIFSIIEGNSPGRIYVDEVNDPKSAFVWDKVEGGYYLAGNERNSGFNRDLNGWITGKIYKEVKSLPHLMDFTFNWYPGAWESKANVILKGCSPMKHYRKHFTFKKMRVNWQDGVPAGYHMRRVDGQLLGRKELKNIDNVAGWVMESWQSLDNFMNMGFGFCLLHGNDIVSWSIADYTAGGDYEIGIHTDEGYRRRGFATLTASAAVEYCLSIGAKNIGWHCWSSNNASAATAVRVGFEQTVEHPIYHAWYNGCDNLLVQAHFLFRRGDYRASAQISERAFAKLEGGEEEALSSYIICKENRKKWCYYEAAKAFAVVGDRDAALRNLKKAIKAGFSDVNYILQDKMLGSLHHTKEYEEVMLNLGRKDP